MQKSRPYGNKLNLKKSEWQGLTSTISAEAAQSFVPLTFHHTAPAKEESIYSEYQGHAKHVRTMKGTIRNGRIEKILLVKAEKRFFQET